MSLESNDDPDEKEKKTIRCGACGHEIADPSNRIEVAGRHTHVFMNPSANIFHVACFHPVPGCECVGEPTCEYSWFPPYAWNHGHCRACGAHLGWNFSASSTGFQFYCLILDRLMGIDED